MLHSVNRLDKYEINRIERKYYIHRQQSSFEWRNKD